MSASQAIATQAARKQWGLRFLNGGLRGRTLTLPVGERLLGSSAPCDVLLPGSEVAPRHLVLVAGELTLVLQRLHDHPVQLNGETVEGSRRSLIAGDVLRVGDTEFQIDHVYAKPAAHNAPQGEAAADSMFATNDGFSHTGQALGDVTSAHAPPSRSRWFWPRWFLGMAALGGVSGLLLWEVWHANPSHLAADEWGRLEQAIKTYPEVEIVRLPGKPAELRGQVESPARLQTLQQTAQRIQPQAQVKVQVVSELLNQAQRLIADPGVSLSYQGRGRLSAQGRVSNPAVHERIQRINSEWQPQAWIQNELEVQEAPEKPKTAVDSIEFWQKQLPARLVSVTQSENGLPSVQLDNKHLYFEGSVFKSGAELRKIESGHLDISPLNPKNTD